MSVFTFLLLGLGVSVLHLLIGGAKLVYGVLGYTALAGAGVVAATLSPSRSTGRPIRWALLSAILLGGYVVWRAFNSPIEYLARPDLYMVIGSLVAYFLAAVHFAGIKSRMWMVWLILGLSVFHVVIGAIQFKEMGNYMLLPWMFRPDYQYRASGLYICPNHLAGFLEISALLSISFTLWGRIKPWQRILTGYCFVSSISGLAITGSRGGYLSIVIGTIVFGCLSLWIVSRVKRRYFWGAVVACLVTLVGVFGLAVVVMSKSARLEQRLSQIYDPTNMRVHMWQAALKTYELSPWTGVGSGAYLYYGRHFRDPSVQNDAQHVHCDYLELLAEYGIIGSAIMAVFLITHLTSGGMAVSSLIRLRLRPARLTQSNEMALLVGILSAFAALLGHSVIDFNLHIPGNTIVCAFLFGILANPRSAAPDETLRGRWSGEWLRIWSPAFAVTLGFLCMPKIQAEYYGERARVAVRDELNDQAIRYAEQAIKLDPRNFRNHYYLGEGRHNLAMLEKDPVQQRKLHIEAARAFTQGISYFPGDIQLLLKLGRTLDNLQRFAEADLIYRQAVLADPNFGNVYAYYGHHYYLQRRLIRAEKLYRKAIDLGEREVSVLGLKDIEKYRELAANEETAAFYPVQDEESDLTWEPGDP